MVEKKRVKRERRSDDQSGVVIAQAIEAWIPKTDLGRKVKNKEFADPNVIFENGVKYVEHQIIDMLVPNLETDMLFVGQSKGKFGGGQRRAFKQTQKKTKEGNKPSFTTCAVIGNKNGFVGMGFGKAKETVPAREKAVRNAKLNMIKVLRGNGSWQAQVGEMNSIPFRVDGKSGSIRITLIPAPVGTGLVVEKECAKILRLAGIKDVWSHMQGCTTTKLNVVKACFDALSKLSTYKLSDANKKRLGIIQSASIATPQEIQQNN